MTMDVEADSIVERIGFEATVALLATMLVWNVWLWTRIKYGEQIISRLTTLSYLLAFVLLSLTLIENVVYVSV